MSKCLKYEFISSKKERGIKMKNKGILTILFPAFFMTIITILGSTPNTVNVDFKGILVLSLLLIFPLLFLFQGIICASGNINVFLSFGVSILDFLMLIMIYLNSSAFFYIPIYLMLGTVGYLTAKLILKFKTSKSN